MILLIKISNFAFYLMFLFVIFLIYMFNKGQRSQPKLQFLLVGCTSIILGKGSPPWINMLETRQGGLNENRQGGRAAPIAHDKLVALRESCSRLWGLNKFFQEEITMCAVRICAIRLKREKEPVKSPSPEHSLFGIASRQQRETPAKKKADNTSPYEH
jgi:hypothetical protein